MKEEKRISYGAGVTRKPSDFLCGDGELAECINLTSDGEELKVMVPLMEKTGMESKKLVFVHKLGNGTENYIYESSGTDKSLYYGANIIFGSGHRTALGNNHVSAMGNTIVAVLDSKVHYFLFEDNDYTNLDTSLPEPVFDCYMYEEADHIAVNSGNWDGMIQSFSPGKINDGKQDVYNDLIVGLYSKNKKAHAKRGYFVNPFFVRVAVELYDGSYTHISQPILMFPSFSANTFAMAEFSGAGSTLYKTVKLNTSGLELYCKQDTDYSYYSDIVKGIAIFVSEQVDVYNTDEDCRIELLETDTTVFDSISRLLPSDYSSYIEHKYASVHENDIKVLKERTSDSIAKLLSGVSVFFKVATIGLKDAGRYVALSSLMEEGVLNNLRAQDRLEYDDYYSHSQLTASLLYPYNFRLNMSGVERGFFDGYDFFMPLDAEHYSPSDNPPTYDFYVTIESPTAGTVVVKHSASTWQMQGIYFYYPDPRATHVVIMKGNTCVCNQDLTEHPGLNGAYFFRGLQYTEPTDTAPQSLPSYNNDVMESLAGYVLTSEVNNPFVFLSHGYNRVGMGTIIGISALTMAYSQDQFGRTDLVVFTDEGVWGMQVDKTGLYENSHGVSRDVCVNPSSITQTDFSVFFVSKRGLMVIDEKGHVSCVSERMDGKAFATNGTPVEGQGLPSSISTLDQDISACSDSTTFHQFLLSDSLRIAYDYIDSRLLLTNSTKGYCWVYSLKTGSFSKMPVPTIHNVVNAYPDYLLQNTTTYKVYTLYGKTREDEATARQKGFLLTRPIKLGGVLTVASLRELVNVGYWEEGQNKSWVQTMVLISDDLVHWYESKSRFGVAAKYFRIALFVNMLPTERLSGTIVREQERRSDNLR